MLRRFLCKKIKSFLFSISYVLYKLLEKPAFSLWGNVDHFFKNLIF